jgi:hypothetical protein
MHSFVMLGVVVLTVVTWPDTQHGSMLLSITTLKLVTLSITTFSITIRKCDTQPNDAQQNDAKCLC